MKEKWKERKEERGKRRNLSIEAWIFVVTQEKQAIKQPRVPDMAKELEEEKKKEIDGYQKITDHFFALFVLL